MDYDKAVTPKTLEEGRKYTKYFTQQMLDRNLSFHMDKNIKNQFMLICLPRSGSNLLKARLEELFGFHISDICPYNPLGEYLGVRGSCNGTTGHCQIIKTHYPHFDFPTRIRCSFPSKKAIIITRDPVNYAISMLNLQATVTHHEKLDPSIYQNKGYFNRFMKEAAEQYNIYHNFWFDNQQIPKLIFRLEDYFGDQKGTLLKIMQFIEGSEDLKPFLLERLNEMERNESFLCSPYIKKGQRKAGESQNAFDCVKPEHVEYFVNHKNNKEIISRLGYVQLLKGKYPFLAKMTDWKDDEALKWIKESNETNFKKSMETKVDDLPDMIVPKWKIRLANLWLVEHLFYTPGTLRKNFGFILVHYWEKVIIFLLIVFLVLGSFAYLIFF